MHRRSALLGGVSATCEVAGVEQQLVAADSSSSGASHRVLSLPVCVTLLVLLSNSVFFMCPAIVACYFYRAVQL